MTNPYAKDREWRKEVDGTEFLISTAVGLLNHEFINVSFGAEDMYWAKPIPLDQIEAMLDKSTTLGLYKVSPGIAAAKDEDSPSSLRTPSPTMEGEATENLEQIGLARIITDHITTAYLTDVYVLPEYRTLGHGRWIIACCKEIMDAIPAMRRGLLMTSPDVGKSFYMRELGKSTPKPRKDAIANEIKGWYDITEEKDHAVCMTKREFQF